MNIEGKFSYGILVGLLIMASLVIACDCSTLSKEELDRYNSLSAQDKLEFIWNDQITPTQYKSLPPFEDINISQLLFSILKKKMNYISDFAPKGWKKGIHRRAVVAKIKYIPEQNNNLTGMLANDSVGLIRMSLTYSPEKRGMAPGIALKLFVDGENSVDVSLLTGLDPHGQDYNFFAKTFSNYIPLSKKWGPKFISAIFRRVSPRTNLIEVNHFGKIGPDGNKVAAEMVNSPKQIFVKAAPQIIFPSTPARDIRKDFLKLNEGQELLYIYAREHEKKEDFKDITSKTNKMNESKSKLIGKIILDSTFIASSFGDDQLFFRHEEYQE